MMRRSPSWTSTTDDSAHPPPRAPPHAPPGGPCGQDGHMRRSRHPRSLLGLLALVCSSASADPPADPLVTGMLVVRVADLDGKPISQVATVRVGEPVRERKDKPDEGDVYRFSGLPPGTHAIRVEASQFRPRWITAEVQAGKTTEIVALLDPGARVEGVVVDGQGKALAGATVEIKTNGGEDPSPTGWVDVPILGPSAETDAHGRFTLGGLAPRDATVEAWRGGRGHPDRLRLEAPLTIHPPVAGLRLVLWPAASVAIRLLTPDKAPYVEESEVGTHVTRWRRGDFKSWRLDYEHVQGGRLVFGDLSEGEHELEIRTRGFVPVQVGFVVTPRTRVDLGDVVLDVGLPVRGKVTGPDGAPLKGITVLATPTGRVKPNGDLWLPSLGLTGYMNGNTTSTAEDGSFTLDHVPAGRVFLEAAATGYVSAPVQVDVKPDLAPVSLRIGQGAAVWCLLQTSEGKPAADERLMAVRLGDDGKPSTAPRRELRATDENGRAGFRLTTGRWRIVQRTFPSGKAPGETPLGEWVFTEGETREIALKLPP